MTTQTLLIGLSAIATYAASSAIEIQLPNLRRISPSAAFGPSLAALGFGGYGVISTRGLLAGALLAQAVIVAVLRRRPLVSAAHVVGLLFSFGIVAAYGRLGGLESKRQHTIGLLAVVCIGAVAYFSFDLSAEAFTPVRSIRQARLFTETLRTAIPLIVVIASTAGLIVLVFPWLTWATFLVMFIPVIVARQEFARYGEAQRTYGETVRALAGLAEGAGYVPQGHQARVADLCVRIGRELSLASHRLRELELVALLHDVGAVSLPDPSDVSDVDSVEVARNTGLLLEETGYLASYSAVVLGAAMDSSDLSLEAKILRVADMYDGLRGSPQDRLRAIEMRAAEGDADVLAALSRALVTP